MSSETVTSSCGVTLAMRDGYVYPLTPCCGEAASQVQTCGLCWQQVPAAYGLAGIVGHRHFLRDLRSMVETLGDCEEAGDCSRRLADQFAQMLDADPAVRIG